MTQLHWITVTVAKTQGSAPREVGAAMQVFAHGQTGTIGGGALEYEACAIARKMLDDGAEQSKRSFPLGPDLGQCCGGSVGLHFHLNRNDPEPTGRPLWIWGAGHVGRAVASVLAPLQQTTITIVDTNSERMPDQLPTGVVPLVASDPMRAVQHAPVDADHLIMTYSHDLDFGLCDALLRHGFHSCGLIGSRTKWTRFQKRLLALGHANTAISDINCPIGDPTLGKHPQAIAIGVASSFLLKNSRSLGRGSQHDAIAAIN